jgi:hypothetical protein
MDIFTGPVGSANLTQQIHDYSPGIPPNGLFWLVSAPRDAVRIGANSGTASLRMSDVLIIDAHDLANALTNGRGFASLAIPPIPPTPATVSFDIEWNGVVARAEVTNEAQDFTGEFVETSASISWSARTDGFLFVSEPPNPARSLYSVIGHERNGVFFHGT